MDKEKYVQDADKVTLKRWIVLGPVIGNTLIAQWF